MGLADSSSRPVDDGARNRFAAKLAGSGREAYLGAQVQVSPGNRVLALGRMAVHIWGSISGCPSIVTGPLFGHLCLVSAGADGAAEPAASRAAWEDGMRREGGLAK